MIRSVPGDKSITQRALILASLAPGRSRLAGLLAGEDPRSTARALRDLGALIPELPMDGGEIVVRGRGLRRLVPPAEALDLGNSGTGARLLLGVLAGQPFSATVTGDASLCSRPMRRVTIPLSKMGAAFDELGEEGRLPARVHGRALDPIDYDMPVASAQVKSSLLLAGLTGGAFVLLTEPGRSRDHTERMLTASGAPVLGHAQEGRWRVELRDPPEEIRPLDLFVPGDFSSAAFLLVLALLGGAGDELTVGDVGLNPTRTGLLDVLERMGAGVAREDDLEGSGGGEPLGALTARPTELTGAEVGGDEVPRVIDELPLVAVAGARARGVTRITGAAELRVKETDRIRALVENLRAVGVEVEELEDGLVVEGSDAPLKGRVRALGDHRIAMAFGVLGALEGNDIVVDHPEVVEVSYPGFWEELARIGAAAGRSAGGGAGAGGTAAAPGALDTVVTIDGPAGSGKSTTAREVARRLGWRYLDSGALYRALTHALLASGRDPETWDDLTADELSALGVTVEAGEAGVRVLHRGRVLEAELRTDAVTGAVSRLAALPAVRAWLLGAQRRAGAEGRLVADGRDMGTVVFPRAGTKIFLRADPEERARRRLKDKGVENPGEGDVVDEAARLQERDRLDAERAHSPLRPPEGALLLDTTRLDFEDQVEQIVAEVRQGHQVAPPRG